MKDKAPEPVLVEFQTTSALAEPEGYRILQDGAWWSYASRFNVFDATARRVETRTGPRKWRMEEPRLTTVEVERLKAAIRSGKVLDLPPARPRASRVQDGVTVQWIFSVDGKTHGVSWMPDVDPAPPAVKAIEELAEDLIFRAQQRWLKDHGLEHTPEE